jgi:hypothetical protein
MPAHKPGESIEGLEIQGHSRDPLRFQSTKEINGIKCFVFKAEFNAFSVWGFIQQTNVKVVTPRQEIVNALYKRDDYNQSPCIT